MEGHSHHQEVFMPPESTNLEAIKRGVESKKSTDKIRAAVVAGEQAADRERVDDETIKIPRREWKDRLKDWIS